MGVGNGRTGVAAIIRTLTRARFPNASVVFRPAPSTATPRQPKGWPNFLRMGSSRRLSKYEKTMGYRIWVTVEPISERVFLREGMRLRQVRGVRGIHVESSAAHALSVRDAASLVLVEPSRITTGPEDVLPVSDASAERERARDRRRPPYRQVRARILHKVLRSPVAHRGRALPRRWS